MNFAQPLNEHDISPKFYENNSRGIDDKATVTPYQIALADA